MLRRVWAALLLVVLALACSRAPFTRRSQLILVSAEQEMELGAQAFRQVLSKSDVETSDRYVEPVERIGQRLARVAERPDYEWRFAVIDDPRQVNAFALPGGKVAVYTGIFPVARDSDGLAVVMGHELAHVIARHGAERISQGLAAQLGASVLGAAVGGGPNANLIMAAYGLGTQLGVLLPYGRTQESEADRIGLILMAKAGYDPRAALGFWERMARASGSSGSPPEFLSTHPSHATREEQIRGWLPEATSYFEQASRAPVETLPAAR
jgi:predicted Zn-dependent protease